MLTEVWLFYAKMSMRNFLRACPEFRNPLPIRSINTFYPVRLEYPKYSFLLGSIAPAMIKICPKIIKAGTGREKTLKRHQSSCGGRIYTAGLLVLELEGIISLTEGKNTSCLFVLSMG